MHPVLFEIPIFGGITIYTYGALVAAGFLVGILWISYETRRLGLDAGRALDLVFYIIVSAILGSRIMFIIITDPIRLIKEPWSIFMVWEGGLVFFGGLIGAVIVGSLYAWRKKMSIPTYMDIFAPAIAIGHACGRIGCLMVGCCYGRPAGDSWFSVTFPDNPSTFAPSGIPLYPTQLIESCGEILIFLGLVLFRKHKKFDGQVFAFYLIAYSVLRFFNEMLRGDPDRGYIIRDMITSSQGISIALFCLGIGLLVWGYHKARRYNE